MEVQLMKKQKENKCSMKLSDFCEVIVDCEHKTAPIQESGIPCIRTKNIFNGYLDLNGANKVSEDTYLLWTKRLEPCPRDIILAREAPVGEVGIVPKGERVCLGQRTVLIRPNKKLVDPYYLLYLLLTKEMKNEMNCKAEGSTVPHLNMSEIRSLNMPDLPSLAEQISISSIIRTLDDKIELNRQMNSTLEQIAQALFKRWFIDFEFPDENGNPYRSSGGRMVDSELGKIPEGWGVGKLGDIAEEIRKNVKVENINPETPYFGLEHIPRKSISLSDWGNANEISSNKLIFEKDNILFGKIRPYFHKVGVAPIDGVCSTDIIVISPEENYYSFVLSIVSSEKFVEYATQTSEGTKMPRANWRTLVKYPVAIPDKSISKRYNEVISDFVDIIQKNIFECKTLSQIRDSLLPKLMSGKIRV